MPSRGGADRGAGAGSGGGAVRGLVIGAPSSGSGKTTLAVGIIAALRARGLAVQPYKVGPDYLDTGHHSAASGRPSRNLDTWMTGRDGALDSFSRGLPGCDFALVEGVMGLFDGRGGSVMEGSTAEVAALLGLPVLLVVDVSRMSGSVAALVKGFAGLRDEVRIGGVILNNVGSIRHEAFVRQAVSNETGVPVLGALPRSSAVEIPSRHLGLRQALESEEGAGRIAELRLLIEEYVDVEALMALAAPAAPAALTAPVKWPPVDPGSTGKRPVQPAQPTRPVRIAVARDAAFSFYYEENLERLSEAGAELVEFSPLHDERIPRGTSGLILGGGYPELHAGALSSNVPMMRSVRSAIDGGMPVIAECGGLMYLCTSMVVDQAVHQMVGAVSATATLRKGRSALGYRSAIASRDLHIGAKGSRFRGHEFHYSELDEEPTAEEAAFELIETGAETAPETDAGTDAGPAAEPARVGFAGGAQRRGLLASYLHIHFGCDPQIAPSFVAACREWEGLSA